MDRDEGSWANSRNVSKMVFRTDKKTIPKYSVLEEVKRTKLRIEAGKRVIKFEGNINNNRKLLNECRREPVDSAINKLTLDK